mgnify:CR=1 FL=1
MAVEEWGKAHNAKLLAIGHTRTAAVDTSPTTREQDLDRGEVERKNTFPCVYMHIL